MTYYKYAEREASSQINWAEVSKGLTDTITQIDQDRQAKKAAIDEATRKDMLTLADAPKGENTTASEWTIKYANDMMNYRLTIDRLLKSGKMSLRDYQVAAQNSKDSTNLVFTIAKEYQDEYKVIMDRMRSGESSRLETEIAALNESYANISSTVPYINSTNGMVYLATGVPGEDGVQQMGDNYVSLQALRNRVKAKIDKYDLSSSLAGAASELGDYTISQLGKTGFRRTGVVTDISDPTLRDTYQNWENDTIEEIMASGHRLASIMADSMNKNPKTGNAYRITMNKDEFDADKTGDVILMANENGSGVLMPQFKEQQRTDVKAFIKGQIKNYIDQKTEKRPFQEPGIDYAPEYVVRNANQAKEQADAAGAWNQLYTGKTAAEKKAAANILLGTPIAKEEGLLDIDLESKPGSVILKYADTKKNRTIDFLDASNNPISLRDFAGEGVELHGVVDRDKAVRAGGGGKEFGRITDYRGIRARRQGEAAVEDINKTYSSHVNKLIPSILKPTEVVNSYYGQKVKGFKSDDGKSILSEEQVADKLNSSLQDLGFEVSVPTRYGNYIKIKNKDGIETEVAIDDPTTALKAIQGFVVGNVPGKDAVERTTNLQDLKAKGVIGETSGIGSKYNK